MPGDVLVAPLNMVDTADPALPLGAEGRHHQGCSAPEVRGLHLCALELVHAAHHGHPALHPDIRPHADQLIHMAVAVLKDVLHKHRGPPALQQSCHQDRLGVGGKSRIGRGAHRPDGVQLPAAAQEHCVSRAMYLTARLMERAGDRGQVAVVHLPQLHLASRRRHRREVGCGHNAVGHDSVLAVVGGAAPLDRDCGTAGPPHFVSHAVQEGLEILDLRLPGGVHQDGGALTATGGQNHVLRGAHAGDAQGDLPPPHLPRLAAQAASALLDLGPQLPQGRQVQVNGPGPQLAPAGHGQVGPAAAGQNGPQENHRGAHLPHQVIRDLTAGQVSGVHHQTVPLPVRPAPQVPQDPDGCVHIPEMGTVVQHGSAAVQNGGSQDREHAVLGPLYLQCPLQGPAAFNEKFAHTIVPPQSNVSKLIHLMRRDGTAVTASRWKRPLLQRTRAITVS